ncbi:MAG TPA: nicotinate phosphoribosyltransferase [Candidatus Binatia bacterium]|jgi:nicotinate phosphoribosyltransferase|nr:nicotinate phosphoribosyltransferase [Candidatus Binatia bacterium]
MKKIIRSLLDLDFYKLTMAQLAWKRHADVPVRYGFTNRTKGVALAETVREEDLRREIDHARGLRFSEEELAYLYESPFIPKGTFGEPFLGFLAGLSLPEVEIERAGDGYRIETEAPWPQAMFWETMLLGIVNELHYRSLLERDGVTRGTEREDEFWRDGCARLKAKIARLKDAAPDAKFIEFGTRRRFEAAWQGALVQILMDDLPDQLLGTSNVHLAKTLGIRPVGTFAHEMYMVYAGIDGATDEGLLASHNRVLRDWWEEYGEPLSIALTDTYGTGFFFRDMTGEQAAAWRGLRQDSGDPEAFGERAIAFYQRHGVDPATKSVVFSDGLDVEAIVRLQARFRGRIGTVYGWGTNLTNDLGYAPLSLVVKAIRSCGRPTVKLSDNPAKATGPADEVDRYKRVFGYEEGTRVECTY